MKKNNYLLYDVDETPPKGKMIILALQHVLAMFGATILVPILVNQAIVVISETRKASATLLQRKLNVGFARAARIMDILEERGVVWPADGAKPRDIFI